MNLVSEKSLFYNSFIKVVANAFLWFQILAGNAPRRNNLFVHIWNIILHQISAKFSDFFRSIAEEKVSALPKRKLRGKR